jgi:hypothetical protein
VVLLYVLSDSWKIDLQVDADLGENIRPTNARQFKNMGRLDRATMNLIVRRTSIVEKTINLPSTEYYFFLSVDHICLSAI